MCDDFVNPLIVRIGNKGDYLELESSRFNAFSLKIVERVGLIQTRERKGVGKLRKMGIGH